METTSTLSQELLRAVTAEPEIAEKVQALVETMEGMIRSKQDAGEFTGLEQLAEDGRVMRFVADTLNKLPEAVTTVFSESLHYIWEKWTAPGVIKQVCSCSRLRHFK